MRSVLCLLFVAVFAASPLFADAFIPGEFNGWDNTTPMTDLGGGVYEYVVTGFIDDTLPTNFVLLSESGNWDSKYIPSGDQWCYADANGDITITLDTNTYDDSWYPQTNRVGATSWTTDWTAVGDWQGWDNANAATAMTDLGGGMFMYETSGLSAGEHWYKAVSTGTWNAIGGDGLSVNADNFGFMVNDPSETVQFYVDPSAGVLSVNVIPEPMSLALLALGSLAIIRRR